MQQANSSTTQDLDGNSWDSANKLIDHILVRYHGVHRVQLTDLITLARRIERVHTDHPQCPHGLAEHLEMLRQELESHMQKEEQILFPLLKRGLSAQALGPIAVMRREHDDHSVALSQLQQLTHSLTLPEGACGSWQALYAQINIFISDLNQHIYLENNILFENNFLTSIHSHQEVNHG